MILLRLRCWLNGICYTHSKEMNHYSKNGHLYCDKCESDSRTHYRRGMDTLIEATRHAKQKEDYCDKTGSEPKDQ